VANFVKKPPLIVNITYLELNGFNASIWASWSLSDAQKSQCIDQFVQIHQICVNKHRCYNHIKFEVSLHFWLIWPTVRRPHFERPQESQVLLNCIPCLKWDFSTRWSPPPRQLMRWTRPRKTHLTHR
jgi:hypothetical protein